MNMKFWKSKRSHDLALAKAQVADKKLWRVTAIEMRPSGAGYQMGAKDHFTIKAYCRELAIGIFKQERMNWFVTGVEEETVTE